MSWLPRLFPRRSGPSLYETVREAMPEVHAWTYETLKPTEPIMSLAEQTRERCLELASRIWHDGAPAEQVVATAAAFEAFVTGKSPRDQINAALDAANVR